VRGALRDFIVAAYTVTDMTLFKHAFSQGIEAQPGVEL
jgi:cob(I)alamin adenosyltransferase